jgi:hypothetical protein
VSKIQAQMRDEFDTALQQIANSAYTEYGSHSFAAGYFQTLAGQLFEALSAKQKREWLAEMQKAAIKRQAAALKALEDNKSFVRA